MQSPLLVLLWVFVVLMAYMSRLHVTASRSIGDIYGKDAPLARCVDSRYCNVELSVDGQWVRYELSSTCRNGDEQDYEGTDVDGRSYAINLCGYTDDICVPKTCPPKEARGAVVRFKTSAPACNSSSPACKHPITGSPICCTAQCDVWPQSVPQWTLLNHNNPAAGGIQAEYSYRVIADKEHQCVDVKTRMRLRLYCNSALSETKLNFISLNDTDPYDVIIAFQSPTACGKFRVSIGWMLIFSFLMVVIVYFFLGILYISFAKQTMALPHARRCVAFCR
eukprot:gb/GECG01013143.1/.p1 GENE.gb/GECG01013143.1/~~gb/GECG01013143.1/.p1  ORF type:complete len:279 (+),score=11.70 gb/GECG01013143.1/:1-837(+)